MFVTNLFNTSPIKNELFIMYDVVLSLNLDVTYSILEIISHFASFSRETNSVWTVSLINVL